MTQERSWVIGSAADCDLIVKDPKVSRRHCKLTQSGSQYLLEDLASTNGTYVNGQRLQDALAVTTTDDITLGRKVHMPWPDSIAKSGPVVVRIGRDVNNDIVLDFPTVSGFHAKLICENDQFRLEDVGSTNGTAVGSAENKIRVAPLGRDDTVYFGSLKVPASLIIDNRGNLTAKVDPDAKPKSAINGDGRTPRLLQTGRDLDESRAAPLGKTKDDSNQPPSSQVKRTVKEKAPKKEPKKEVVPSDSELSNDVPEGVVRLREKLIGLQIVSEADWRRAVEQTGSEQDIGVMLRQLRQMTLSHRFGGGEDVPVLSDFQQQKILAGEIDDLRMDNYVILDRIGGGGMGEVFKALNVRLSRLEAIKTITTEAANIEDVEHRFRREARILAALSHPNISTVHDSGFSRGKAFIAMEYISGQDMKAIVEEAIEEEQLPPIDWATEQIVKAATALQKAHDLGIVHRDIKPGNIMITDAGELKVLDMGIARIKDPSSGIGGSSILTVTNASTGLGTPEVMPPEQWRDATSVTAASDIYSLGCTFYYMLTGQMPFLADNLGELMIAHASQTPRSVRDFRSDCPKSLDAIIQKMLAKEPNDRFATAEELIDALQNQTETTGNWLTSALVAGVLLLAAAVALYAFR